MEEIKIKAEEWIGEWIGNVVWMSKGNGKIEVDRCRMVWELLAKPSLNRAVEVWLTGK